MRLHGVFAGILASYTNMAAWDCVLQPPVNSLISLTELGPPEPRPPAIPHSIVAFDRLDVSYY
jgi:hypothetical protein